MYLWRAVDAEGEVLDVLLQAKCDTKAARRLMRKLLRRQGMAPDEWFTDKNPAYGAALRELKLTRAPHTRRKCANNRAESSHVPVRRRERKLQGFKSPRSAQRFLSLHAATYNVFTVPRHLTTARGLSRSAYLLVKGSGPAPSQTRNPNDLEPFREVWIPDQ
jgi:putative transposase